MIFRDFFDFFMYFVFFFNDTATTEIYTLSLHDALQLLLHRKRRFDGRRRHDFQQQVSNSLVHCLAGNPLAHRLWIVDRATIAEVVRHALPGTDMVNHLHSLTADTTDNQTLQQRGTFTRRTLATLGTECMSIFLQPSLILLVFLPGDVTDMRAEEQRVPFVFRYAVLLHPL